MSYTIRMYPSSNSGRGFQDYSLDDYNKMLEYSRYPQVPYIGKDLDGVLYFPFDEHSRALRDIEYTPPSPQLKLEYYTGKALRLVHYDNAVFLGANLIVENETVYLSKDCKLDNSILLKNCEVVLVGGSSVGNRIFYEGCKIRGAIKKDGMKPFTGTLEISTHAMPNFKKSEANPNVVLSDSVFSNCELNGISVGSEFDSYINPVFKMVGCKIVNCDFGYLGRKKHDHGRGIVATGCTFEKSAIDGVKMISENCDGTIEVRHTKQTSPFPTLMIVGKAPKVVIGKESLTSVRVVNATDSVVPLFIDATEISSSVLRGIALNGKFDVDIDERNQFTTAHATKSTVLCSIVGLANKSALDMGINNNSPLWNQSNDSILTEFDKNVQSRDIADITIPPEKLGLFGGYTNPTVSLNGDPVLMFVSQIIGLLTVDGRIKNNMKAKSLIIKSTMESLKSRGYADRNHIPEILETVYSKTSKILRLMGLTTKGRLHYMKESKTLAKWWMHDNKNDT